MSFFSLVRAILNHESCFAESLWLGRTRSRPRLFGRARMGTEKCPFCGQEIDAEATRCFFCGARLDENEVEKRLEQLYTREYRRFTRRVGKPVALEVIVVLILTYIVLFHGEPAGKHSSSVIGTPLSSAVRLNAKVTFAGAQLIISNNDSFDWENVKLEISSGVFGESFGLSIPKISAGETYVSEAAEFRRKDGSHFDPVSTRPQKFWIRCYTPGKESGSYMTGWQ